MLFYVGLYEVQIFAYLHNDFILFRTSFMWSVLNNVRELHDIVIVMKARVQGVTNMLL
jgi:hypothetical protein